MTDFSIKAPFPYFGGKSRAASAVWSALGDVEHYVEPFAGSLAVLLRRPHLANRPYYSETVNDLDGLLVNFWRAVQAEPEAVAHFASWPVAEADQHARHLAILKWRSDEMLLRLCGDADFYDAKIAGYWVWGLCCWVGSGWCSGVGPWVADADGRFVKQPKTGRGVWAQKPHISDDGQGVNKSQLREPGVSRQKPFAATNGRGVNHGNLREPGVHRKKPHISNDGRGVNHGNLREPGVTRQKPHISDNGQGVNHGNLREPGVGEPHPMTMPKLLQWMRTLAARLRHVRILNGDWSRAVTKGTTHTLSVRQGGVAGVFLDPPYGAEDIADVYNHDSSTVAQDVAKWCLEHGDDDRLRIVLAGFEVEHTALEAAGWRVVDWYEGAGELALLKGGYGKGTAKGSQMHRDRLWLSPACLGGKGSQVSLF